MRFVSRFLCLMLVITFASCGGSATPVVRDYTSGNPARNVHPQSVVGRCPPDDPSCVGSGGGGGGCDTVTGGTRVSAYCGLDPGYNIQVEQACNATGGIYISLESNPYYTGMVQCANSANQIRDVEDPNGCQGDVTATWYLNKTSEVTVKPLGGTATTDAATKGLRVGLDCYMTVDGFPIGYL